MTNSELKKRLSKIAIDHTSLASRQIPVYGNFKGTTISPNLINILSEIASTLTSLDNKTQSIREAKAHTIINEFLDQIDILESVPRAIVTVLSSTHLQLNTIGQSFTAASIAFGFVFSCSDAGIIFKQHDIDGLISSLERLKMNLELYSKNNPVAYAGISKDFKISDIDAMINALSTKEW